MNPRRSTGLRPSLSETRPMEDDNSVASKSGKTFEVHLDEGKPAVATLRGRLIIALATPGSVSRDVGCVCVHPVLCIRGRTYCPKAPTALISGKYRLK